MHAPCLQRAGLATPSKPSPILYRSVSLSADNPSQLQRFHSALSRKSCLVLTVHALCLHTTYGRIERSCQLLKELVLQLTELTYLRLNLNPMSYMYGPVFDTLSQCKFRLVSLDVCITSHKWFKCLLESQPEIEILTVRPSNDSYPVWRISSDALPKLARLRSACFFVRALCAHPRLIHYLDLSGFGSSHSVGLIQAVRATGNQLTHFVYRAHTRRRTTLEWPTWIFREHALPRLRHLKVIHIITVPEVSVSIVTHCQWCAHSIASQSMVLFPGGDYMSHWVSGSTALETLM